MSALRLVDQVTPGVPRFGLSDVCEVLLSLLLLGRELRW